MSTSKFNKKENKQPLSNLQRTVCRLAKERQYVCYADVLIEYYGFSPSLSSRGIVYFSSALNERKGLKVARVAICKSFNRLVKRKITRRVHGEGGVYSAITLKT